MNEEWEDLEGPGSMVPYRTVVCSLTIPGEPDPLTTFIIATLAIAFAAFCVWLTVRIVNRRERWAKWTLAAVVSLPALYVASFGPACWISSRTGFGARGVSATYQPLVRQASWEGLRSETWRRWFADALAKYSGLGAMDGWSWYLENIPDGETEFVPRWSWLDYPPDLQLAE